MALMRSTTTASTWMKHWPRSRCMGHPCCALGQRRGDGVIGRISKGDANYLRALDPGRAVISWRDPLAAEGHRRRRTRGATNKTGGMFGMLSMLAQAMVSVQSAVSDKCQ